MVPASGQASVAGSDSSMDDCNPCRSKRSVAFSGSDSSMDDCNGTARGKTDRLS